MAEIDGFRKETNGHPCECTHNESLTCNCVTAGNYGIYSAVSVYPVGENGSHALANKSTECSPCTTQTQNFKLKIHEFTSRLNGFHSLIILGNVHLLDFQQLKTHTWL